MKRKTSLILYVGLGLVGLLIAAAASMQDGILWRWPLALRRGAEAKWSGPRPESITLPFQLLTGHILLQARVDGSRPLSFLLDTGDRFAVIDTDRAKELGIETAAQFEVKGVGSEKAVGALVKSSTVEVVGLPGFSQALTVTIPLRSMASKFGHDLDGLLGANFLRQFVVEIDYPARTMTLFDPDRFHYSGPGESIPLHLDDERHPVIEAEVTAVGAPPVRGSFALDLGAGDGLVLFSPFVAQQHLPGSAMKTMKALGGGIGGTSAGRVGHVESIKIGRFTMRSPNTLFSEDHAGAYASALLLGAIDRQIVARCRVFLDYPHGRLMLEPVGGLEQTWDVAMTGIRLDAEGADYSAVRVSQVLEDSPGSDAGLQPHDLIRRIDDQPASALTLSDMLEMFEQPRTRRLEVQRGAQTLTLELTPKVTF